VTGQDPVTLGADTGPSRWLLTFLPLCADGGKSSPPSIKPGEDAPVAVKLDEKEGSEASDSKEKVGLGRTSDHPGGEKYSPKVSFVLRQPWERGAPCAPPETQQRWQ